MVTITLYTHSMLATKIDNQWRKHDSMIVRIYRMGMNDYNLTDNIMITVQFNEQMSQL